MDRGNISTAAPKTAALSHSLLLSPRGALRQAILPSLAVRHQKENRPKISVSAGLLATWGHGRESSHTQGFARWQLHRWDHETRLSDSRRLSITLAVSLIPTSGPTRYAGSHDDLGPVFVSSGIEFSRSPFEGPGPGLSTSTLLSTAMAPCSSVLRISMRNNLLISKHAHATSHPLSAEQLLYLASRPVSLSTFV